MTIVHNYLKFEIETPSESGDTHNISVSVKCPSSDEILWECNLKGLWKDEYEKATPDLVHIWSMHSDGDYFQHTLIRHNKTLHPRISYTALFHEMVRNNIKQLAFIKNIYSTSEEARLSMGYTISPPAKAFWNKQVENNLASFIPAEKRFKVSL